MNENNCSVPNSNQIGGDWSWIRAVGLDGCAVYITCDELVDCLPPSPESPTWDGSSPTNSITIVNDGAGSPPLGHEPVLDVNIAEGPLCPNNALSHTSEGLCVPQGANGAVTGPIVGSGTDADPWRLDFCGFGNIPNGTSVTHLGFSAAGCLVRDVIPTLNETTFNAASANAGLTVSNGGPVGHTPTFTLNVSPSCANNLLSIQADGLCVQETPLTVQSSDGTVIFSQSGTANHTVDLRVPPTVQTPWEGVSADDAIEIVPGGTDGHAPTIGIKIADNGDCPDNQVSITPSGLCVPGVPLQVGSSDGSVGFTQSGTLNHTLDLTVTHPDNPPLVVTSPNGTIGLTQSGTDDHTLEIDVDICNLNIPAGGATRFVGVDAGGCLVTDTVNIPIETPLTVTSTDGSVSFTQSGTSNHTLDLSVSSAPSVPWTGTAGNQGIFITPGGTDGHAPSIALAIANGVDCPNNIAALAASGLCVQETPLQVTSNDGSVTFTQSGTADHTLDLSVSHPANPPLAVSSPNGTISFTQSGTDNHTLSLDVDLCNLSVPAGNAVTFVGIAADGCMVTDSVSIPGETPFAASSDASIDVTPGGTNGHTPGLAVNISPSCANNLLTLQGDGLCVQETPITLTSNDGSVTFTTGGTANHTIDLSVASSTETPLTLSSPSGVVDIVQSGTANHTATLEIDWCNAGGDIPNGTPNGAAILGIDLAGCVVKGPAGFFAQSNGANDFIPLGSNYDVAIDYTGANGTSINGQPVFNSATNTLHFPLIADDDYRRIGDAGPTYKAFTEADQAWRTGDVVWGDSAIQANTKGDFRGNLNVGPATNIPTLGQFTTTQGTNNVASGQYAHASGIGAVASGAVAAWARGVAETAGGWVGPTQATGTGGMASGRGAQANSEWSLAVGRAVQVNGNTSMGLGSFVRLDGVFSGAVGRALTSTANGSTAFLAGGFDNTVDTQGSAIIAAANGLITTNANFSLLHGNNNTINSGGSSFNSGDNNVIDCFGTSMVQGRDLVMTNPGGSTEASGIFGRDSSLSGEQCYSFGRDLLTGGFHCFNQGQNNTVFGNRGVAIGQDNFVNNADVGAVIGSNNTLGVNAVDGYLIGEGNNGDAQNIVGLGKDTNITHAGSILLSATTNVFPVFNSTTTEQFGVRAPGGIRMTTNGTATTGAFMNPGGSFWGAISARETKTDIDKVNVKFGALERISSLPLYMFRYKEEAEDVRNLGPMAEEWEKVMSDTGLVNKKAETRTIVKGQHKTTQDKRRNRKPFDSKTRAKRVHSESIEVRDVEYLSCKAIDPDVQYETKAVTTISPNDLAALSLAGIQELIEKCEALTKRVAELENPKKKSDAIVTEGKASFGSVDVFAKSKESKADVPSGFSRSGNVGTTVLYTKNNKGAKPVRRGEPSKIAFRNYVMNMSLVRPTHRNRKRINGVYVWVIPHHEVVGEYLHHTDWKGTGIGPKTIETLNELGVWTVDDLRKKEAEKTGWINDLSGISDSEYEKILAKLETLP